MLHPGQVPVGLSVGMAAPWHALVDELQGNYSIELYGKPNSVDADHLQLIWTPLLTPAALEALQMLGVCHFQPEQEQPLFYPLSLAANPRGSVWKRAALPVGPTPSHSWVEVTHCGKSGQGRNEDGTPAAIVDDAVPWFYPARGSGVSINVGRTVSIDLSDKACEVMGQGKPPNEERFRGMLSALPARCLEADTDVDSLDSAQLYKTEWYSSEKRWEIILLSTTSLTERQTILETILERTQNAPAVAAGAPQQDKIMCGRWPELFRCSPSSLVLELMRHCPAGRPSEPGVMNAMRQCGRLVTPGATSQMAWFHPPKTGSSFGTVLAHAANTALPLCARLSVCSTSPTAPIGENVSLHHPYTPHRCHRASDYFMKRFPPKEWFPRVAFWPAADEGWGKHDVISESAFQKFNGSFYGLFRSPSRLIPSNYIRMLDVGGTEEAQLAHAITCLSQLGMAVPEWLGREHDTQLLRNFSAADSIGHEALRTYAHYRRGHATRLMAGQGDARSAASECPAREQAVPDIALALQRLGGFRFVGLTDDWERSICLFHVMHGGHRCAPAEINRPTVSLGYDHGMAHAPGLLDGFVDAADEALYEAAYSRFEANLAEWNVTGEVCRELKCTSDSWPGYCNR